MERWKKAHDKAEFDWFMAERGQSGSRPVPSGA
jgi:hypothetical protein